MTPSPDLIHELRASRPSAPADLRTRVRAVAVGAAAPGSVGELAIPGTPRNARRRARRRGTRACERRRARARALRQPAAPTWPRQLRRRRDRRGQRGDRHARRCDAGRRSMEPCKAAPTRAGAPRAARQRDADRRGRQPRCGLPRGSGRSRPHPLAGWLRRLVDRSRPASRAAHRSPSAFRWTRYRTRSPASPGSAASSRSRSRSTISRRTSTRLEQREAFACGPDRASSVHGSQTESLDAQTEAVLEPACARCARSSAAATGISATEAEARMSTIQLTVVTPGAFGAVAPPSRIDRAIDEALNVLAWEGVIALGLAHRPRAVRARRLRRLARPPALPPARRGAAARDLDAGSDARSNTVVPSVATSASATTLSGRPGDLARLAQPRERLFLSQPFALHEDPLCPLDRLAGGERLRERVGLLAQRGAAPRVARVAVAIAGSRSLSRNGLTR